MARNAAKETVDSFIAIQEFTVNQHEHMYI
jgi:hypothetical protein